MLDVALDPDLIYLNHAGVGPWTCRARDAVTRFAEQAARHGARDYPHWLAVETRLRHLAADLTGAGSADDIALLKNTSEALSVVAHGFPWQAGDRVLISNQEFPSNRIVWEALGERGVTVDVATLGANPEDDLLAAVQPSTRLVAVSAVQYATGLRLDLARLGPALRQRGVALCVDAIQHLGALPFHAVDWCIDFAMADGHKWLLAPEGLAIFYCHPDWRTRLRLHQHGWHMVEACGDYDATDWQPAASARRFECGSPNLLAAHALAASLEVLLTVGIDRIAARILDLSDHLLELLHAQAGLEIVTPQARERRAGIVSFRPATPVDSSAWARRMLAAGVVCAPRAGGLRLSPHAHNSADQLRMAVQQAVSLLPLRGDGHSCKDGLASPAP